ncbi:MAG: RNA-binding protein [Deltaproteobacteria bacterium]|nr:RNA-binding protein [Deltaproteobacteria bacterium]MBW1929545.1 RNA-binding protein [Deltaproteobacteria bacterium]MBW2026497.1 RNA-binding protein [Deltaproteobacteria bacterium]MBW2124390.1 RNA-binding protein [Deltaproteobacteria bacterium]RLB21942.1 MAG: RNA-binding protein [Deltaproteobacteria bacterium]
MKKIYVGNLAFRTSESQIHDLFSQYGQVHSVKLITDYVTGRSRGFGFVEMDAQEAQKAIAGLNGTELDGRILRVDEAKERKSRSQYRNRRW